MNSRFFRSLRLGGVLTSPQAAPSGLQMTPPSLPGMEKTGMPGSPDFILILHFVQQVLGYGSKCAFIVRSRSHIKVIHKGHQMFASFRHLTLLSMHKNVMMILWLVFEIWQRMTIRGNNKWRQQEKQYGPR